MAKVILETNVELALKGLFRESIKAAFPAVAIPEILISQGKLGKGESKAPDYQCNNAMALAKALSGLKPPVKMAPKLIGEELAKCLPSNDLVDSVTPTPQGFINIYISQEWICGATARLARGGLDAPAGITPEKVLVDFSSPNIAKEMHVGHLRSTIIGEAMAKVLEYCGHETARINHVGDWGTQFGMLIHHLRDTHKDFLTNTPNIGDLVVFYRDAKKRFDEDEDFKTAARLEVVKLQALDEDNIKAWKMLCDVSRVEFEQIYSRLNINVKERGESFYNPIIPSVLEKLEAAGQVQVSDGASIITSTEEKATAKVDAKDMVRLLGAHFIQLRKGQKVPEYHANLIPAMQKAGMMTGDADALVVKLGKATKPWAEFDHMKDVDKLAKGLEPLYVKVAMDDLLLAPMKANGALSEDLTVIKVPRFSFPLIVRKSDGGFTYDTTDLTAMWHRFEDQGYSRVVYVTDVGQFEHFKMCAQVAQDMGWIVEGKNSWQHGGFGLVSGNDGKKFKTRSGDTVKLKDLLDEAVHRCYETLKEREEDADQKRGHSEEYMHELATKIGFGAVRYFDLKQSRTTDYTFSYDKMLETTGNTAVYMLYSYARICSIQAKANCSEETLKATKLVLETDQEKALALCAMRMNAVIIKTAEDLFIHHITDFVYELTCKLSDFYTACRVIDHEHQASRLLLLDVVRKTMAQCLELLGIEPVERI